MKPHLLLILLLCAACEPGAASSGSSSSTETLPPRAASEPPPEHSVTPAQALTSALPDNPLEAVAQLSPEQSKSLRQNLFAAKPSVPDDPALRRVQTFVYAFLQSHYRNMLQPPTARREKLPPGAKPVKILSHDGIALQAAFIPAKKPTRQTVILLHGYGSHLSYTWIKYSFLHSDYNLLLLDQRGHNGQAGKVSLGIYETRDLLPLIRWLSTQQQDGFALVGESLGAAVAISGGARWAASPEQQAFPLRGVWSDAAYADLAHAIGERAEARLEFEAPGLSPEDRARVAGLFTDVFLHWLARDTGVTDVEAEAAPSRHLPALVTRLPVTLVHSSEDEETSYANAERLAEIARQHNPQAQLWTTHGFHADSWRQPEYQKRLKAFLAEVFKG